MKDKSQDENQELPGSYSFEGVERRWIKEWYDSCLYSEYPKELSKSSKAFCMVMPPPNITGVLHMGHALVSTLQDVLVRWKRMCGFDVLWVPGIDHAGIATQTAVERELIKSEGKRCVDYCREDFLRKVWEWKCDKEKVIVEQIRALGCSCNWSCYRFTMDANCSSAVNKVFKKLFDDGLVYRGNYLVNWDTITQTAISDDEVEYEEEESSLWHFRYPYSDGSGYAVIATTRPETMLGDSAVAVNPSDERYKDIVGKTITLPIVGREIPIVADDYVDKDFGTGMVKITPAHDSNDYDIGLRHKLAMINMMTQDGNVIDGFGKFSGLSMKDARYAIVEEMRSLGLLDREESYKHRVGYSYRSKAIVEPYLSRQWFVKMEPFKKKMREAVSKGFVNLIPKIIEGTYFHWLDNLRDWCISRQLLWGHRIPIWYNVNDSERMICLEDEGELENVVENPEEWKREEDVLDTWFSSSLWPFSALGWPGSGDLMKIFYPNSALITGHDILFFWVARMIMMGEYICGEYPFRDVFFNGLLFGKSYWRKANGNIAYIVGKEVEEYDSGTVSIPAGVSFRWEKMSKSKGNVIDTMEMVGKYGLDAVRIALCSCASQSSQIDLDRRVFESFKNFANKLWNAARFVLMNLDGNDYCEKFSKEDILTALDREVLCLEDWWILSRVNKCIDEVNFHLHKYAFDKAAKCSYDFFWNDFCSYYLEICKIVIFGKEKGTRERKSKQKLLLTILANVVKLIHPIMPVITEEIFYHIKKRFDFSQCDIDVEAMDDDCVKSVVKFLKSDFCSIASYEEKGIEKVDCADAVEDFNHMRDVVYAIRNLRGEMKIPLNCKVDVYFELCNGDDDKMLENVVKNAHIVRALIKVKNMHFNVEANKEKSFFAKVFVKNLEISIPLGEEFCQKEKSRLKKEIEATQKKMIAIDKNLANEEFVKNAPSRVVNDYKEQKESLSIKLKSISDSLAKFQ